MSSRNQAVPLSRPRACSLAQIEMLARRARLETGRRVLFAGSPAALAPPEGLAEIIKRGGKGSLGFIGGLTQIKNAAAFTAPVFSTTNVVQRTGPKVEHFAVVNRTVANDVTHDCFYPAPGDHLRPGMSFQENGRTYEHYERISPAISDLIRRGEQEHLDDARRAFELTYKLIADKINALAGRRFGPASTPFAAQKLAESELAKLLPPQLGINPANWAKVLDRLLSQSTTRDTQGWHTVNSNGPPKLEGNKSIYEVGLKPTAKIGSIPSSQVVNY